MFLIANFGLLAADDLGRIFKVGIAGIPLAYKGVGYEHFLALYFSFDLLSGWLCGGLDSVVLQGSPGCKELPVAPLEWLPGAYPKGLLMSEP